MIGPPDAVSITFPQISKPSRQDGSGDLRHPVEHDGAGLMRAADIDGDGLIGVGDLIAILVDWGGIGGPADLDASGVVAFPDLVILLIFMGTVSAGLIACWPLIARGDRRARGRPRSGTRGGIVRLPHKRHA